MSETIAPRRFHEVDWRVVRDEACAHFRAGSFESGSSSYYGSTDLFVYFATIEGSSEALFNELSRHLYSGLGEMPETRQHQLPERPLQPRFPHPNRREQDSQHQLLVEKGAALVPPISR
jgi:hypothetical protein